MELYKTEFWQIFYGHYAFVRRQIIGAIVKQSCFPEPVLLMMMFLCAFDVSCMNPEAILFGPCVVLDWLL